MTEHEASRLLGDILLTVFIGGIFFIIGRIFWLSWKNGIRWVRVDDDDHYGHMHSHSMVNTDGTPMINGSIDMNGNPYGVSNRHH